ncbi:MAG TPA: cation diffusion facilitator family transporter [Polyangia bacterium]|jgi:cation diffusion facilitator family transporter
MASTTSIDDGCAHAEPLEAAQRLADERRAAVRRVFLLTLGLNAAVALAKAGYGYVSGSLTLGTDSLHSILDASSNVLALFGLRWSAAPADQRHPYGRQKIEILAALGIGVMIVAGLFEFGAAAVHALLDRRPPPHVGAGGFVVVLATMVVNLFVARYEQRKASELGSALLRADAHHTQSDLYASTAVVASFIAARAGIAWADGVATLLLIVLIGHAAWEVFRENIPVLIDAAILDAQAVAAVAGPLARGGSVHRVRSRGVRSAVELDLHLEVAPDMSVEEAHRLARQIGVELKVKFPEVSDVIIHIEPKPHSGAQTTR